MSTEGQDLLPDAHVATAPDAVNGQRVKESGSNPFASLAEPEDPSDSTNEPDPHRKPCDICGTPRNVLIRCQIDKTKKWVFVCTGKCWTSVSGGSRGDSDFPDYTYGGTWKNKHAYVSGKIKGVAKETNKESTRGFKQRRPWQKSMGRPGWQKEGRSLRDIDVGDMDEEQSEDPDEWSEMNEYEVEYDGGELRHNEKNHVGK